MIHNYIKIAIRNLIKFRIYSFINILGLSVGITACILILLFIQDELSYDQFNVNKDRIYRVTREWFNSDGTTSLHLARVAPPIGPLLQNDFPDGIKKMARIRGDYNTHLRAGKDVYIENGFLWAEETIFDIFSFPMLRGNKETALSKPNALVVSRSTAIRLFGSIDAAMGKVVNYEGQRDLLVTGVVEDVPHNSHIRFDFLGSLKTLIDMWGADYFATNWGRNNFGTYLLLAKNFSPNTLREQIPAFLDRHLTERAMETEGHAPDVRPSRSTMLHLQKLTDIHLHSHLNSEWEVNGDIRNIYLFLAIAFFILLIACINFMNLATARSAKRAKEIGMRRVLGAQRKQLIFQFLGESFIVSFISLLLAIIFLEISLPYFNNFVGKNITLYFAGNVELIAALLILMGSIGILAGVYPALYLSGLRPLSVIKDSPTVSSSRSVFRTTLVVAQFAISISLIICMGIVHSQIEYWLNKDLGYDREHIVILPSDPSIMKKMETVKARLRQNSNIVSVASSRLVPTNNLLNSWGGKSLAGDKPEPLSFRLAVQECDYDFIKTYRMKIIAGRDFSKEYATDDSAAFILNESAVRKMGWKSPEKAIGEPLEYGGRKGWIIGVVKDFNFESLRNEIAPIIFLITHESNYRVSVRIRSQNVAETLQFLKSQWQQLRPDYPFEYRFLDDQYHNLYKGETQLGEVFGIFALLAIFIACLGLLGLVSFTAEQKTKEIGIRKVLGASVDRIVLLLIGELSKWVLMANLIAWPLVYYYMNRWLQNFAYRVDIDMWIFLSSAAAALFIALLTVSFQAIKAAIANPVESLRYE